MANNFSEVIKDLKAGIGMPEIWWRFGCLDIRMRYRRTFLGPFWMTISYAISVAALGLVFSTLFKLEIVKFLPYLAAGLAAWTLISTLITEGCSTFINVEQQITTTRTPMSVHAIRMIVRNVLVYCHNIVVAIGVSLFFDIRYGFEILLILPAILLVCLNATWIAFLLGIASARYRDLPHVITLMVGVTFFVTPIFWTYDMLGWRSYIADYNPLYHFVELLRAPLISTYASVLSWKAAIGCTIVGWLVTLVFAMRFLRRVPYWL